MWAEYSSFWCIKYTVYLKGLIQLTQSKPNINGTILMLSCHLCVSLSATVPHAFKVVSLFKKAPYHVEYVALHGAYHVEYVALHGACYVEYVAMHGAYHVEYVALHGAY